MYYIKFSIFLRFFKKSLVTLTHFYYKRVNYNAIRIILSKMVPYIVYKYRKY
jgi:hypothetical protein